MIRLFVPHCGRVHWGCKLFLLWMGIDFLGFKGLMDNNRWLIAIHEKHLNLTLGNNIEGISLLEVGKRGKYCNSFHTVELIIYFVILEVKGLYYIRRCHVLLLLFFMAFSFFSFNRAFAFAFAFFLFAILTS
jgi:hypothetical protein